MDRDALGRTSWLTDPLGSGIAVFADDAIGAPGDDRDRPQGRDALSGPESKRRPGGRDGGFTPFGRFDRSVRFELGHLLFHPELFLLQPGERGGVGTGPLTFLDDPGFEAGMLGLEGRNVRLVHSHLLCLGVPI
jgi:hypothetical protein